MDILLNHHLTGSVGAAGEVETLAYSAVIYSKTASFVDYEIPLNRVDLISRGYESDGSINLIIPITSDIASELNSRMEGGVLFKIYVVTRFGVKYVSQVIDVPISDYRFDVGASSQTYTLTCRGIIAVPAKNSFSITKYFSKVKINDISQTLAKYAYSITPNLYQQCTVGSTVSVDDLVGIISEVQLKSTPTSTELTIEIQVAI